MSAIWWFGSVLGSSTDAGPIAKFGIYIARRLARVIGFAEDILAGDVLVLSDIGDDVIHNLREQLIAPHRRIRWYEDRLKQATKEDVQVRPLRSNSSRNWRHTRVSMSWPSLYEKSEGSSRRSLSLIGCSMPTCNAVLRSD